MASLRQIRRRMKSIDSIHEITKAMEMIAAFRFKKAENRFTKSRVYLTEMEKLAANLSAAAAYLAESPEKIQDSATASLAALFEKREVKKKALIVMTGDKGLCGAYNTNLIRQAMLWLKENKSSEAYIVPVGKIGHELFRKRSTPMLASYLDKAPADISLAKQITEELKKQFLEGKVDSVELLYTSYRPGGAGRNVFVPFLGLRHLIKKEADTKNAVDYIFEPDFNTIFSSLLARFLEGRIYLALLESLTSEYSARMVAMKQATENGEEVLGQLKLLRNKTRQATITRELAEIVSGASILL